MNSPLRPKQVLISGYYGFGNAGDELILKSLLNRLRKENCQTLVLSNRPRQTENEHRTMSANRWSPWAVAKEIFKCDYLIFGGGGLLQDRTGSLGLWYYLLILWTAILFKKKIAVTAIGIGPIGKKLNRLLIASTLKQVQSITVRDTLSLEMLEEILPNKKVGTTSDLVLLLDSPPRNRKPAPITGPPRIVLIPRNFAPSFSRSKSLNVFCEALNTFSLETNAHFFILPFQPSADGSAVQFLRAGLNPSSEVLEWKTLDELIQQLSRMDLTISMRLHGLILSALIKIPAVGISVDPKISIFLKELSGESAPVNLVDTEAMTPQEIAKAFHKCWKDRRGLNQTAQNRLHAIKKRTFHDNDLFTMQSFLRS